MKTNFGKIFIIYASSGAGKTTVLNTYFDSFKEQALLKRVITYTTRAPRPHEKEGIDYYFLSIDDFKEKIEQGFFLEWSLAYGAYYGSPYSLIIESDKGISSILILDRNGVKQYKALYPDRVVPVLITVSYSQLEQRLHKRDTENKEDFEKRMKKAVQEENEERKEPLCAYQIENNIVRSAVNDLHQIVMQELEIIR